MTNKRKRTLTEKPSRKFGESGVQHQSDGEITFNKVDKPKSQLENFFDCLLLINEIQHHPEIL